MSRLSRTMHGTTLGLSVVLLAAMSAALLVNTPKAGAISSASVKSTLNVSYSNLSPTDNLDIYQPLTSGVNRMGIILIHGGGYTSGSKSEFTPDSIRFAEAGWVSFNINYSLNGSPNEADDAYAAVQWVRSHAATYGVDPSRIAVLGASAGGTLAGMVATQGAANGAAVSAVASWSGPMDLSTLVSGSRVGSYAYSHPLTYVGGCVPTQCNANYVAASPVDHVSSSTAPMLIANSTMEIIPLTQAQEMDNALIAAHVPQELDVIPGHLHATSYSSIELASTMAFLTKYVEANPVTSTGTATTTTAPPATTSPSQTTLPVHQPAKGGSHNIVFVIIGVAILLVILLAILLSSRARRRGNKYWRAD
jgi:acetyl esterase/lipase